MIKIPYNILPIRLVENTSSVFLGIGEILSRLSIIDKNTLKRAGYDIDKKKYISMCFFSSLSFFILLTLIINSILLYFDKGTFLNAVVISLIIVTFTFLQQLLYPNMIAKKRADDIDKNILSVTQNILIQLRSGVPLFEIFVSISKARHGVVSKEFMIAVKEINAGTPQVKALESIASRSPSKFLRSLLWQIVNAVKSGADLAGVIEETSKSFSEEQVIQIQNYGSTLSPLAMFYMMIAVIIPSLGMTFLILISSFIALEETTTKLVFASLYIVVVFAQFMFIGMIKTKRPNLM